MKYGNIIRVRKFKLENNSIKIYARVPRKHLHCKLLAKNVTCYMLHFSALKQVINMQTQNIWMSSNFLILVIKSAPTSNVILSGLMYSLRNALHCFVVSQLFAIQNTLQNWKFERNIHTVKICQVRFVTCATALCARIKAAIAMFEISTLIHKS